MPYADPKTPSPLPSPAKEHAPWRKHQMPTPSHIEHASSTSTPTNGGMPGIPRRSSSSSSTPRRHLSPNFSRHSTGDSGSFAVSRPMEGLPRRSPSANSGTALGIVGLPSVVPPEGSGAGPSGAGPSSLGLRLHGSPSKAPLQHHVKEAESPSFGPKRNGDSAGPFPSFDPSFQPQARPSPTRIPNSRPIPQRRGSGGSSGHIRGGAGTGSLQIPFPTSASTSELPSAAPTSPMALRPHHMIRKKSGEVVKPSLKQRSMSTPDLMRQGEGSPTDESASSGFERSKSVRFADASEGDAKALESVVLFLREQKVTAVGKAADPENAQLTETETENDTDVSDFVQFRTRRNAAARAADEQGQFTLDGASRVPRKRTDFSPDARGSLVGENVVLERVELQGGSGLVFRGTAIVRNVAFKKWVAVRFTLDHWQTVSEVAGTHVCHIPSGTTGDEGWDRFSFSIKLEDYRRKIDERQLILCVHFSVEGKDWWDSNDGMNYNFTFKKTAPRRVSRASGPASLGGSFLRLNEPPSTPLPGLRSTATPPPSSQIKKAFSGGAPSGAPNPSSSAPGAGPKNWVFPKLSQRFTDATRPLRPDSPVGTPPPNSYKAPAPPTVHTHLSLSKYCAPSPPQSPPKESGFDLHPGVPGSGVPVGVGAGMDVHAGNYATLSPPPPPPPVPGIALGVPVAAQDVPGHDRRSSWNGQASQGGSWDSFAQVMGEDQRVGRGWEAMGDGEATPVAQGSRSPEIRADAGQPAARRGSGSGSGSASGSSRETSPHKPLSMKRSTGDLRKLVQEAEDNENGLITPPSSNLSSPPTPSAELPPTLMSPSPSASTGDSSPVNTVSTESTPDLAGLAIDIHPEAGEGAERGRSTHPKDHKMFTSGSYQEFLDKFCFFQSPRSTPSEIEPVYTRPSFIPLSGHDSPGGFPFYHHGPHIGGHQSQASHSPRNTPTPTRHYASAQEAFGFTPSPGSTSSTTPKGEQVAAGGEGGAGEEDLLQPHPQPGGGPTVGQLVSGFHANPADTRAWAQQIYSNSASPSLAAAK
ncbi:hypothetical protein IAT38_001497 [Cryptococcus sp. DSM 104549]